VPATPEVVMLATRGARRAVERLVDVLAYSGDADPLDPETAAPVREGTDTQGRPDTAIAAKMGAGG
jgi:hypothetical protein